MCRFIITMLFVNTIFAKNLNVCKSLNDYFSMNPKNCWHNPEFLMTTPQIIIRHGYPLEVYKTCTEDGYNLTMFRLPQKNRNRRGIVYMQHAMATNSLVFVDKGVNISLAFVMYDQGYEIWLGNSRGTQFSRKHKTLDVSNKDYWNFSFHEVGKYDIKSKIDLIVNVAKANPQEISYIGISMSSTAGLVYATLHPEHSTKWLNVMILMAPTSYIKHKVSWVEAGIKEMKTLERMALSFGMHEVAGRNNIMFNFLSICRNAPFMLLCVIVDMIVFGGTSEEVSPELIPVKYAHNPDSCSTRTILHYLHLAYHGRFVMYDYGSEQNFKVYNSKVPPEYPIQNISVPIVLFPAEDDVLSPLENSIELFDSMPAKAKVYGYLIAKDFGHASFVYSTNLVKKVNTPITDLINSIRKPIK